MRKIKVNKSLLLVIFSVVMSGCVSTVPKKDYIAVSSSLSQCQYSLGNTNRQLSELRGQMQSQRYDLFNKNSQYSECQNNLNSTQSINNQLRGELNKIKQDLERRNQILKGIDLEARNKGYLYLSQQEIAEKLYSTEEKLKILNEYLRSTNNPGVLDKLKDLFVTKKSHIEWDANYLKKKMDVLNKEKVVLKYSALLQRQRALTLDELLSKSII